MSTGWGRFSQKRMPNFQTNTLTIIEGEAHIARFGLQLALWSETKNIIINVKIDGRTVDVIPKVNRDYIELIFKSEITVKPPSELVIECRW